LRGPRFTCGSGWLPFTVNHFAYAASPGVLDQEVRRAISQIAYPKLQAVRNKLFGSKPRQLLLKIGLR
jgi:hypothetical protein